MRFYTHPAVFASVAVLFYTLNHHKDYSVHSGPSSSHTTHCNPMDLSLYHKNGSACNDYHGPRRDDGLCVGQDNRNNDNKYPGAILQVSFHSTKEAMNCQPYNEVSQSRPHPKWWEHNLYFELKHYIYYFLFCF